MAGRYPPTAFITIGLVLLNLAAWVVLLGGAAGLQKDRAAVAGLLNAVNQLPGSILAYHELKPINTNQNFISYQWYKAVVQALTLLAALGAVAAGFLYHSRIAFIGMFAVLAVYFSDSADTFYYLYLQSHKNPAVPKKIRREVATYFSGCIMCAALNFLLIISLGLGAGHPVGTHANTATTGHTGPVGGHTGVKDTTNGAPAV